MCAKVINHFSTTRVELENFQVSKNFEETEAFQERTVNTNQKSFREKEKVQYNFELFAGEVQSSANEDKESASSKYSILVLLQVIITSISIFLLTLLTLSLESLSMSSPLRLLYLYHST